MRAPLSHPLSRPFRSDIERMFSEEALDRMAKAIVREEAKTGRIKDLPPEASTTWLGLRRQFKMSSEDLMESVPAETHTYWKQTWAG